MFKGAYMKTAVVFYSLSGSCALIAQEIKARLGADIIRLHTEGEKPRGGFGKFFWAGSVMLGIKKAPLKPYTFNPSVYDLIIIGAPVWAGSPARPVQAFLSETGITGKKIALFLCHGGGVGKAMEKLEALLPNNDISAEADFIYPLKNIEKANQQVVDWVKSLQGK
jgi:flavodoxin